MNVVWGSVECLCLKLDMIFSAEEITEVCRVPFVFQRGKIDLFEE